MKSFQFEKLNRLKSELHNTNFKAKLELFQKFKIFLTNLEIFQNSKIIAKLEIF